MKKNLPMLSIVALVAVMAVAMTACNTKQKTGAETNLVLSASDTAGLADFQEWKVQNERKDPSLYVSNGNEAVPAATTVTKPKAVQKTTSNTTTKPVAATKKKGWSKAAKGAAIGTATGAIAGVLISKKNPVLGGIIGGVAGGGIGYGIGRSMDKKDGRY